jgi:DNA modification methylase
VRWSGKTLQRADKIETEGNDEDKQLFREGKKKIGAISKEIENRKNRQKLIKSASNSILTPIPSSSSSSSLSGPNDYNDGKIWLIHADFKEKYKLIPPKSVKLIFTDAPYDIGSLDLIQTLGEVAEHVLEERGSLVFYGGQYAIEDIIKLIKSKAPSLKLLWLITVKHNGASSATHGYKIRVKCKQLFWFIKANSPDNSGYVEDFIEIDNLIESTPPDKSKHKWAQSTAESDYLIEKMTWEGQTVLDVMMGSGTWQYWRRNYR